MHVLLLINKIIINMKWMKLKTAWSVRLKSIVDPRKIFFGHEMFYKGEVIKV